MVHKQNKESLRSEMVQMLDGTATVTVLWITWQELPVKEDGYVPRTLLRFGVQRGALRQHT